MDNLSHAPVERSNKLLARRLGMISKRRRIEKSAMKVESGLEEQRCPRCHALLFRADADGHVEIKCRKCGHMIKRTLSRVTVNRTPLTGSPTEGRVQSKSPARPLTEQRENELGR